MTKQSAGLLLYRKRNSELQFFLVHPGGPYFKGKDAGVWSIPKGEYDSSEDALSAAKREFEEETGLPVKGNNFIALTLIKQKGGKIVSCWAIEADVNQGKIVSNSFDMEYPYKSGKFVTVPEIDRAGWFNYNDACVRINERQKSFLDELLTLLTT
ncbi:NUDIX domain-containing protein [Mucilaginibacter aquatilis]|uniref:NUDIX domain-containing protein n=1 Tax=Mucilaginibacter aquatilis TaxID=1517760 RepID=A0A6I4IQF1_9SPHI|nr:NUDIX domain-containing protein [Mucilaginibacter aquatilis]MVN91573.1 NUDIX domain-containing protein [Mucilaginibacter aquatilis]